MQKVSTLYIAAKTEIYTVIYYANALAATSPHPRCPFKIIHRQKWGKV